MPLTTWTEGSAPWAVETDAIRELQVGTAQPGLSVVLGSAGTGKSTAVRAVARSHSGRVAIFAARDLADPQSVVRVGRELRSARPGDLVIIDGLDELPRPPLSPVQRTLTATNTTAHVVITARAHGREHIEAIDSITDGWTAAGRSSRVIRMTWTPPDLDDVLRNSVGSDFADILRDLLGDAETPRVLLERVASFLAGSEGPRPDIILVPDLNGTLRVEAATRLPTESVRTSPETSLRARPWVLLRRSRGIWLPAADALEELINAPGLREQDLQEFFQEHPQLLTRDSYVRMLAHPTLPRRQGNLIPDFMLEPEQPNAAGIVELKLPSERVVVGSTDRLHLAAGVSSAIAQVREYGAHFEEETARDTFRRKYGFDVYWPRAAILIGRDPDAADPLALRRVWRDIPQDVEVHTYDDLLRKIRRLGSY